MFSVVQIISSNIISFQESGLVAHDICDNQRVIRSDEHILRLDVPVNDVPVVELRHGAKKLESEPLSFDHLDPWDVPFKFLPQGLVHVLSLGVMELSVGVIVDVDGIQI